MKLFSIFEQVLDEHTASPRQIVLAFSGGLDSRVMLDLLATYRDIHPQHQYLIVHVHHGLSTNADKWFALCEDWSKELDFAFKGIRVQVKSQGKGVEHAAREARYQAILNTVQDNALVLTGHHADDQAETFLLALKRGSGVAGLAAMPSLRKLEHVELLRPLLSVYRDDILSYAEQQGFCWIEDESNFDSRFDRNFIRHDWLPLAQQRWPSIVKSISRSAAFCAEQEALLDELLIEHDQKIIQEDGGLLITVFNQYSAKMQVALLRRWLKKQANLNVSKAQLEQIFCSIIEAGQDANPQMQFADFQLRRFRKVLYLLPRLMDVSSWQHELKLQTPLTLPNGIGRLELIPYQGNLGLGMRAPALGDEVRVRFNCEGLCAHPKGRQGSRKLKKLFQEYGVPSWQRKRMPLIFYGSELAAIANLFVCQDFAGQECELIWNRGVNL